MIVIIAMIACAASVFHPLDSIPLSRAILFCGGDRQKEKTVLYYQTMSTAGAVGRGRKYA